MLASMPVLLVVVMVAVAGQVADGGKRHRRWVLYTFQIVVGSRVTSISTPFVLSMVETKMD